MWSQFDTKILSKTENNFFKRVKENKKKNTFLIGEIKNYDSPKGNKNFNFENSYHEKIGKNFNFEKKNLSKNAEKIKRLKNSFEKAGKLIDDNFANKKLNKFNNLQGSFNKKFSQTDYFKKLDERIFDDNDNKNNINSDLLRLELMNLNCYTQKDIKSINGNGNGNGFSSMNNFYKERRTKSTFSLLDKLSDI